jgi:hypothetical protein
MSAVYYENEVSEVWAGALAQGVHVELAFQERQEQERTLAALEAEHARGMKYMDMLREREDYDALEAVESEVEWLGDSVQTARTSLAECVRKHESAVSDYRPRD